MRLCFCHFIKQHINTDSYATGDPVHFAWYNRRKIGKTQICKASDECVRCHLVRHVAQYSNSLYCPSSAFNSIFPPTHVVLHSLFLNCTLATYWQNESYHFVIKVIIRQEQQKEGGLWYARLCDRYCNILLGVCVLLRPLYPAKQIKGKNICSTALQTDDKVLHWWLRSSDQTYQCFRLNRNQKHVGYIMNLSW